MGWAHCRVRGPNGNRMPGGRTNITWGGIVNRTYGTLKNLYIYLFFPTIFGPVYYGPP